MLSLLIINHVFLILSFLLVFTSTLLSIFFTAYVTGFLLAHIRRLLQRFISYNVIKTRIISPTDLLIALYYLARDIDAIATR